MPSEIMPVTKRIVLILAASISLLNGCGGGGGGGVIAALTGHVVDGSVSGATVMFDLNDDGICGGTLAANAPELLASNQATTDASGNFTYPAGIAATHIVCASGGTDIATGALFVGQMKAPSGSTQITPLTTLVQATIDAAPAGAKPTSAQATATIAANLGLGSTNLLTADPVALAASNPALAQTTAAVQTLLVQAANNVAAAATGAAPTATQTAALYSSAIAGVAKAVAAQVTPVNLTSTTTLGTTAATNLITAAISDTVTAVQGNPTAAASVAGVANLAPAIVAAAAAANVTSVTQTVAVVPAATLVAAAVSGVPSVALAAQTSTLGATTTAALSTLLTTTASTGLAATANTAATIATAAANVTTALSQGNTTAASAAVVAQATAVNAATGTTTVPTTAPTITLPTLNNVLVLSAPMVNGVAVNTTGNPYTVTVKGPLTIASMNVRPVGTPTLAATSSAGFSVTEVGGSRVLTLVIDQVNVTNTGGVIGVSVPASAHLSAYGTNVSGTSFGVVLTNAASNVFTSSSGVVTVNWSNALTALSGQPGFANLSLAKGTFNVSVVLSGLPLATLTSISGAVPVNANTSSVSIPVLTPGVPNGAVATGQGATVQVVVQ